jgi:metal-dependent amidase/aminoacylase/carboxypeptidase family protein
MMGSEDFADMLRAVPGAYALGRPCRRRCRCTIHRFVLDDGILPVGASLLARLVETRLAAA